MHTLERQRCLRQLEFPEANATAVLFLPALPTVYCRPGADRCQLGGNRGTWLGVCIPSRGMARPTSHSCPSSVGEYKVYRFGRLGRARDSCSEGGPTMLLLRILLAGP